MIAKDLRVSVRSVQRWWQAWEEGGPRARRSTGAGVAFSAPEHLVQRVRRGLRHIQYRSDLIDRCLAETGLTVRTA